MFTPDADHIALAITSPAIIGWVEPGFEESDGANYELTAWIDRDLGTVEAVTTEDGDMVIIDTDIELAIDRAREFAAEAAAVAAAGF